MGLEGAIRVAVVDLDGERGAGPKQPPDHVQLVGVERVRKLVERVATARMLLEGNAKVPESSYACGFQKTPRFNKVFESCAKGTACRAP